MEFIAFDFETATAEPNSACSLAAVRFADGEPVDSHYRLFQPPENKFDDLTIRIHQIRPADVADAPILAEVWDEFLPFFDGTLAFAHNAAFDTEVLTASLGYYSLSLPSFHYACTVKLSRRLWPELPSHALDAMGQFLGYRFRHHRADEDALICGYIVMAALTKTGYEMPADLLAAYGLEPIPFPPQGSWEQGGLF